MKTKMIRSLALAAVLAAAALHAQAQAPAPAGAAPPGIKRTILQRTPSEDGKFEIVLGLAEIVPGGSTGRHSHPGVETGMVLEGSTSLEIDGEVPRIMKAGESYAIPTGKVHNAAAVGDVPTKVLATYVVEKGKPLAIPAPK
jgi:quercetin dioxygenase-like cupin family protein